MTTGSFFFKPNASKLLLLVLGEGFRGWLGLVLSNERKKAELWIVAMLGPAMASLRVRRRLAKSL